ncbi:MAG: hypothetical protein PHF46_03025 [Candidatus Gracilibacteria bacterium]|nr:hypothetical protein [Candidatus Gracilibacteria bacterium]MDD3120356.1 hypothetical protein [Candidatus Gracilibacteria bacterium]MDD4530774.1 hypothetical protein [Candidatus Gracilibacteria bacterium]
MITFDKIVKKLSKSEGKIFDMYDIGKIIDPDFSPDNKKNINKVYKTIYLLKASGAIFPIKNSLFYINTKNVKLDENHVVDDNYWKILKKIISTNIIGNCHIGGIKSLEILLKDYSLPEEIVVYNKDLNKKWKISKKCSVTFKSIKSGAKSDNKNIFNKFFNFVENVEIEGINFKVAGKELALLDSLIIQSGDGINYYLINKFLKKYHNSLNYDILSELVRLRYITSINRLRKMAQEGGYDELYKKTLEIIKNAGSGCFMSV